MPGPTHYDTLRIAPSATDAQVREAYRHLARVHHPDRAASTGSAAGSTSMPAINEAYRVLGDPGRRAVYDASLRSPPTAARHDDDRTTGRSATNSGFPMHPSHLGPARIPWRSMLVVAIVGVVGVVVLAQFTEPGTPRGPDGILGVGSCVSFEPNGDAREVSCTDDVATDLKVEAFIPFDATCPGGTEPHRDRQGMGVACIALPNTGG